MLLGGTNKRRFLYKLYNWTGARREDWEKVKEGDKVIIYCTGTVKPYPRQISHTGEVQKVQFTEGNAVMEITMIKELNSKIRWWPSFIRPVLEFYFTA